jgi:hypothetical protein
MRGCGFVRRRNGRSPARSRRGIFRRPDPPSAEAGRGRWGIAYSGFGSGFERLGGGDIFTRRGSVPGRGAEDLGLWDEDGGGGGGGRLARLR